MAGYIVTSSSNFTPFTYDELVKPVMQMTEWHNAAADEYDKLAMDTMALQNYIDSEKDVEASKLYQAYQQRLQELQNNLWEKGFTAGTRRDLAAARAGYSSDITRLAKAVENRQARSREYWDTRHKNPDMIMSADPGTESLDSYLSDDNFGQNWYSYSGNTFAEEVAQEMDARANELLRNPEVSRIPGLAGYIDLKRRQGFTNDEINAAGNAAWAYLNGDTSLYESLNPVEQIAAGVLVNRMGSTGASIGPDGNVSAEEYLRLFQYGLRGASKGIKAPDVRTVEDKAWDFQKQVELIGIRDALSRAASGQDENKNIDETGYSLDPTSPMQYSENAQNIAAEIEKLYGADAFKNGPIDVNMPDGTVRQVSSAAEMTSLMYDTPERRMVMERFGIDIALPAQNWLGTSDSRQTFTDEHNGKEYTYTTGKLSPKDRKRLGLSDDAIAIRQVINGRHVLNDSYTKAFNDAISAHNKHVETMQRLNRKQISRDRYSINPIEESRLKTKYNLDSRLSVDDIPVVMDAKNVIGTSTPATLVDGSEPMKSVRQDYQNNIVDYVNQSLQFSGQKAHSKNNTNTAFTFFPFNESTKEFMKEGTTDKSQVFPTDKNGKVLDGSLRQITATPNDLANGMVRILTDKGTFRINVDMLGSVTGNTLKNASAGIAEYMRILNEADTMLLDHGEETVDVSYNGVPYRVKVKDIIRDKGTQRLFYNSLIDSINQTLAGPREIKGQSHFQTTGNTSTHPARFNALGY